MNSAETKKFVLTAEECNYIEKLIIKNQTVLRSVIKSVLGENFNLIGEECISNLYLLMCEKTDILKKHENPDGWVIIAARNIAKNAQRKLNTQLNRTSDKATEDITAEDDIFENVLCNIWLEDGGIDKLLEKLTPREKEIYNHLYRERITAKDTSEIMNLSDSTVRNINANIKRKIKKEISKLF